MVVRISFPEERLSLEALLNSFGRHGGPTEYGWHTHEPSFRCWYEHHLLETEPQSAGHPGKQFALAVGTIVHEFLAAYYHPFIQSDQPSAKGEGSSPEELYTHLCANGYTTEANEAQRLYSAYRTKYNNMDSYLAKDVRTIAIEHRVQRDFPWGQHYTARADMVIKLPDGYWLVDHKTTVARTTEFVEGWQVEPGIIGLMWACAPAFSDAPIRGVSINGIIKTKVPDFDRFMYARDDRIIDGWLSMMKYKWLERDRAREADWPPNFGACFRKMGARVGKCRFWSRCVYGVTRDEEFAA